MAQTFRFGEKQYSMLDESKLTFAEARAVEKVSGRSFSELADPAVSGSMGVMQALLWVSMKRAEPTLKFADLDDMPIADFEWDDDEEAGDPGESPDPTDPDGAEPSNSSD